MYSEDELKQRIKEVALGGRDKIEKQFSSKMNFIMNDLIVYGVCVIQMDESLKLKIINPTKALDEQQ